MRWETRENACLQACEAKAASSHQSSYQCWHRERGQVLCPSSHKLPPWPDELRPAAPSSTSLLWRPVNNYIYINVHKWKWHTKDACEHRTIPCSTATDNREARRDFYWNMKAILPDAFTPSMTESNLGCVGQYLQTLVWSRMSHNCS